MEVMLERIQKGEYRFYRKLVDGQPTGEEFISVTACLSILPKPGIILWAVMQTVKYIAQKQSLSDKVMGEAFHFHKQLLSLLASEGTEDHNIIEDYLKGIAVDETDTSIKRFKEFEAECDFHMEATELMLYNDKLRSAGTADLIGHCSGVGMVVDLKTSKAIRLSHKIQAVVYKYMYGEHHRKAAILLIPREAKKKWEFYILTEEEEKTYLKIYFLLSQLFYMLWDLGEIDPNRK
jgi:hypothetical protein